MTAKKTPEHASNFFPFLNKYKSEDITIDDKGLERYINIETKDFFLGAPYANRLFGKSKIGIVERIINNMMRTEDFTGKKTKAFKTVRDAMQIIEKKTKQNPVQTLINALQYAAPKEETTRLRFGGISVPKAVDIAPQRRLDISIRNICKGSITTSRNNKKSISSCLADELLKASNNDPASFAIAKKNDIERVARSAR